MKTIKLSLFPLFLLCALLCGSAFASASAPREDCSVDCGVGGGSGSCQASTMLLSGDEHKEREGILNKVRIFVNSIDAVKEKYAQPGADESSAHNNVAIADKELEKAKEASERASALARYYSIGSQVSYGVGIFSVLLAVIVSPGKFFWAPFLSAGITLASGLALQKKAKSILEKAKSILEKAKSNLDSQDACKSGGKSLLNDLRACRKDSIHREVMQSYDKLNLFLRQKTFDSGDLWNYIFSPRSGCKCHSSGNYCKHGLIALSHDGERQNHLRVCKHKPLGILIEVLALHGAPWLPLKIGEEFDRGENSFGKIIVGRESSLCTLANGDLTLCSQAGASEKDCPVKDSLNLTNYVTGFVTSQFVPVIRGWGTTRAYLQFVYSHNTNYFEGIRRIASMTPIYIQGRDESSEDCRACQTAAEARQRRAEELVAKIEEFPSLTQAVSAQ